MKAILLTVSIIFISLMLTGINYADFGAENVMGVWLFNEGSGNTIKDYSANGNDGEISSPKWIDGVFGGALEFHGVDDYAEVPDDDTLDAELNDGFTIMLWTQMYNADTDGGVYSKASDWEVEMCYLLNSDHGNYEFAAFAQNGDLWLPGGGVDVNIWYHVTVTYDGDTLSVYYGGDLVNSQAYDLGIANTDAPLFFGTIVPGDSFYNGAIDELAIFNTVLDTDDMKTLAEDGLETVSGVSPAGRLATTWGWLKR